MDQPVIRLTSEIPQNGLAQRAVFARRGQLIKHPELLSMRGIVFAIFAMRQPPAKPRLPHARIANQHNLGGCGMDSLFGAVTFRFSHHRRGPCALVVIKQHVVVKFVEVDLAGSPFFRFIGR